MATRFGAYSAQPFVPPADYGAPTGVVPAADYNSGNKKSHYPFSTIPDSYTSSKNTTPTKESAPSEPPVDYNSKVAAVTQTNLDKSPSSESYVHKSPSSESYGHGSPSSEPSYGHGLPGLPSSEPYGHGAVPLPDYNSPKSNKRIFGNGPGSRYGQNNFSNQRSIGVPVLPPMDPNAVDREPGKVGAGQNRAWLHHLKNHRKFDTLNSFRSVDDCPICQAMDSSDVALTMRHRNRRQTHQSPIVSGQIYQAPQGPIFESPIFESPQERFDQLNMQNQGENKETLFMQKLNSIGVVVARAVQDRVARKGGELTVVQGELLEVGFFSRLLM